MASLDNVEEIKSLDKSGVWRSIEALPQQCQQAWEETHGLNLPADYSQVSEIVVAGMGGSGLSADVISSLFKDKLKVPLLVERSYSLPDFADQNTLVIVSSYSGTTEETLSCLKDAQARGCKLLGITTGGTLAELMKTQSIPGYIFNPTHNPAGRPRLAIGYSVFGQIGLLAKLGLIDLPTAILPQMISTMNQFIAEYKLQVPTPTNQAKKLASQLTGKIPVLVTAEHLTGVAHVFNNLLNESAKNFSIHVVIPELNHHLLDGLNFPQNNSQTLVFLLFNSSLYPQSIQHRFAITEEVIQKNQLLSMAINLQSSTIYAQAAEFLVLGSYVNYYLAILNGIDPAPVPWVDYLKNKLK